MAGLTAIKRKGFRGGGMDASTSSYSQSFDRQMGNKPGTTKGNPDSDRKEREGQGAADRTNQAIANRAAIREQIKRQELEKIDYVKQNPFKKTFDFAGSVFDFGKNYIRNRKKGLYNIVPNNPKRELEYLSSLQITDPAKYNSLPQNLKDVLEATQFDFSGSFKDQDKFSYDDFESLTQFDNGAFAKYAKDRGSPGLSVSGDMSKVGMKSVRRDQFGNPVKDMFGNTLFDYGDPIPGGGGGGQNLLPLNYGVGVGPVEEEKETQEFVFDPSRFGAGAEAADVTRASYIFNRGGRVPRNMGGIMNAVPRQGYFLGKIVKGVGKAIGSVADAAGKVLKSDFGKAALAGAAFMYGPKMFGATKLGGLGGYTQLIPKMADNKFLSAMLLNKDQDGFNPFKVAGLFGIGASAFMPTKVDQLPGDGDRGGKMLDSKGNEAIPSQIRAEIDEAYESGDVGRIKEIENYYAFLPPRNQYLPYPNYAVGGRVAAQEGGLMNLGGMEKDYRAEGGFVPIGKEEKADDVPARLSVNEFVFTADAVRNAGGGDIDRGAEVMENMMKNLENGGRVSEESQGNAGAQDMFSVSERIGEVI
jgi:hypothetical protein